MANRYLLPVGALVVSLLIFSGALVFALQPARNAALATPTTIQAVAIHPITGTSVVVAAQGIATSTPIAEATTSSAVTATISAPATVISASVTTPRATAAAVITPTVTAPPTVAPMAEAPPVAAEVTPTVSVSAGALPPAITPAAPPPADAPAAPVVVPPIVAPPTAPPAPTPAPPAQPTEAPAAPPIPPVTIGAAPRNVGVPVRVIIPSIGVDATVEQVGVAADGTMATPEDPWNTGWYAPGIRPGQAGNAAIAGHVDYHGIGPVVFWDLNKLAVGAEVLVVTDAGQTLRFRVRGSEYYTPDNAPLQEIFGAANTVNLNLITCGGTFNPATRSYDQRLVLFTSYAGQ